MIAWNGVVRKWSGDHMHESSKDKISCMLVEEEELEKALENPVSATPKALIAAISSKLMENDNVLLNNAGLMSSERSLERRLDRGKKALFAKQGIKRRHVPKYFNDNTE